jgi:protein-disulfide isomerase
MLARCAGPAKYFPMIDALYRRQASMLEAGAKPNDILRDVAKSVGGLTDARFDACLKDEKALAAVNARSQRHADVDKVTSTPSFFVNGKRLEGELTLDQVGAAVRAAGRKR